MTDAQTTATPTFLGAAGEGVAALLTVGISVYAAAILVGVGLGISYARKGRRQAAIICAVVVGILTVAGVIIAIASSIH